MDLRGFFKKIAPVSEEPAPEKRARGRPSAASLQEQAEKKRRLQEGEDEQFRLVAEALERDMQREQQEQERRHQKRPSGHTNWSLPENVAKLSPAVTGWLDGTAQEEKMSMATWAQKHGVPKGTLSEYVTKNEAKRKKIGTGPGKPPLLDAASRQLVADVVRRADRANKPKSMGEVVDVIQELAPGIDRKAARNAYYSTIKPEQVGKLTGCVKSQATTSARSAVTVAQQYRWYRLLDEMYAER